ncbi:hypothetical protein HDG34_002285 [Paraburkholderia sp. HC6.4b]|nr:MULTISPECIES: hypothetical protein [unclassified Paraburkholderia]MBB5408349.1 hypothetical protein [Paraburkholderia sp. HC6.4b]MBB5451454.1 hypothetical protein [Paraburkholderia sp. Kb1A]
MRQSERFYQVNEASHGSGGFHGSGKNRRAVSAMNDKVAAIA